MTTVCLEGGSCCSFELCVGTNMGQNQIPNVPTSLCLFFSHVFRFFLSGVFLLQRQTVAQEWMGCVCACMRARVLLRVPREMRRDKRLHPPLRRDVGSPSNEQRQRWQHIFISAPSHSFHSTSLPFFHFPSFSSPSLSFLSQVVIRLCAEREGSTV